MSWARSGPLILRETFNGAYRFDRLRKLVAAAPQDAALEVTHRSTRSLSRQANFRSACPRILVR